MKPNDSILNFIKEIQEIQMQTFWRTADRLLVAEKKKTPHSPVKIVASVQAE
jgi:hypothetical protein